MRSVEAAQLSDAEQDKVCWENAARCDQLDPFAHRFEEECTVASLRSRAADVDTTPGEYGGSDHTHNLADDAQPIIRAHD